MSGVKQRCHVDKCDRAASTKCFCCNKNVCTRHFTEHIEVVKAQIDPLTNDINSMTEKIQGLTIEQITESFYAQLHQWKDDMHRLVDEIFLAKSKEMVDVTEKNTSQFEEYRKQQCLTMISIQDAVRQLVENDDVTFQEIQIIRKRLTDVETGLTSFKNNFMSVNTRVLTQGLVTVSSNLSRPASTPVQPAPSTNVFGTSPFVHVNSQTSTTPNFGGFGPGNNHTSTTPSFGLIGPGNNQTPRASVFGLIGPGNNQTPGASIFGGFGQASNQTPRAATPRYPY